VRSDAGLKHGPDSVSDLFRAPAQSLAKGYHSPPSGLAVEKSPFRDIHAKHFFKTESLGTKLYLIGIHACMGAPLLILDWIGLPACSISVELHDISPAVESQMGSAKFKIGRHFHTAAHTTAADVDSFVHQPSLGGMAIFLPHLLNMDKRALSWAEGVVLKR